MIARFSVMCAKVCTVLQLSNAIGEAYQRSRSKKEPDCMSDPVSL
jgi:hypothetical protein